MPKPLRVRYPKINKIVDELLTNHRVKSPSVPVDKLASACGIKISFKILDGNLAGFLLRNEGEMVIGVNEKHPLARQRFTIAHELGHALLHDGNELHLDHNFRINLRSVESGLATDVEEIEANTFAASLLMPSSMLLRDLKTDAVDVEDEEQVGRLAQRYQVSRVAMSFRLMNLLARM